MGETLPTLYIARHGETAWSLSGQRTGLTDLPLTDRGQRNARHLGNIHSQHGPSPRYLPVHYNERAAHVS